MNRTILLLAVALLLSLGLNAIQWFAAPSPDAREAAQTAEAAAEADEVAGEGAPEAEDQTGCWVELANCRADAVDQSVEAAEMLTDPEDAAPLSVAQGDRGSDAPAFAVAEVDEEFQEEVLCAIALQHLREQWQEQKDATLSNLRRSLADDAERGAMLDRDVLRAQQLFEVDDAERAAFEEEYRRVWEERVSELRAAIGADPPDSGAALSAARELFEDEDSLVSARFGEDGRRKLRVSQAERRTAVLALLAAHADVEWDDAISW